ncbi:MAG: Transcription regulator [Chthonomonadaceae bacterium]|nr:Transcription regulator [Chthonomonadaceae bacterium]
MSSQQPNTAQVLSRIHRITVIVNPAAGRGTAHKWIGELEIRLSDAIHGTHRIISWQIVETTGPGDATRLAREAVAGGADIVVAAGGDGTIGEVVNALVGTKAALGVIPMGTGNDFARSIGIGADVDKAIYNLLEGVPMAIDVGRTQGRYFVNVAGCGFDAVVAQRVNQGFRNLRGTAAYLAAVLQCLMSYRATQIRLTLDDEVIETKAMLCSVANARYYGGGMRIAPEAMLTDGLYDICLIKEVGKFEFLRTFPKVFKGQHTTHPAVKMLRSKYVKVESDRPLPVLVDGEIVGTTPVEFEMLEGGLTLIGPYIPH